MQKGLSSPVKLTSASPFSSASFSFECSNPSLWTDSELSELKEDPWELLGWGLKELC